MRVAVAISGGVDSSCAALLLKEAGHRVSAVTMRLVPCAVLAELEKTSRPPCCRPEDLRRAAETARILGIPHHVLDLSAEFERLVVTPTLQGYLRGRTPNPCVLCNAAIKFGVLLEEVLAGGFTALATGHYARIEKTDGRLRLLQGADPEREQSYFLYPLDQRRLARVVFPLGGMHKEEARERVRRAGLPAAEASESRDLCFVTRGNLRDLLRSRHPKAFRPGPVKDLAGHVIGEHDGACGYTIGQRKGLGVATGQPLYVVGIEVAENALYLGPEEALYTDTFHLQELHRTSGLKPHPEEEYQVRIRYRSSPAPARLEPASGGGWSVKLTRPLRAVTPGQSAVFYRAGEVLFGGEITGTRLRE